MEAGAPYVAVLGKAQLVHGACAPGLPHAGGVDLARPRRTLDLDTHGRGRRGAYVAQLGPDLLHHPQPMPVGAGRPHARDLPRAVGHRLGGGRVKQRLFHWTAQSGVVLNMPRVPGAVKLI